MKNIFKTFVNPKEAAKYKTMSLIIAFIIFIFIFIILQYPCYFAISRNVDKQVKEGLYDIYKFNEMEGDVSELSSYSYVIKEAVLTSNLEEGSSYKTFKFTYTKDEVIDNIYIVFDPYDIVQNEVQTIYDEYIKKYNITSSSPKEETQKAAYASYLTYKDKLTEESFNQEESFTKFNEMDYEELGKVFSQVPFFEYYNVPYKRTEDDKSNTYMLAFNKNYVYYQRNVYDSEGKFVPESSVNMLAYGTSIESEFNDSTSKDLGNRMSLLLTDYLKNVEESNVIIPNLFYILLFPIILVFIFTLFSKRIGKISSFKEGYNIASLCAIVPFIICFIVGFFVTNANFIFALLFAINYIIFTTVINREQTE